MWKGAPADLIKLPDERDNGLFVENDTFHLVMRTRKHRQEGSHALQSTKVMENEARWDQKSCSAEAKEGRWQRYQKMPKHCQYNKSEVGWMEIFIFKVNSL